jgi:hypothetical protein
MSYHDSHHSNDDDGDDRGELIWNEFDWEHYLRDHDEIVLRFLGHYEQLPRTPNRLDETARLLGWGDADWAGEAAVGDEIVTTKPAGPAKRPSADRPPASPGARPDSAARGDSADDNNDDDELAPYTHHQNPVFIASRALLLSLQRGWEQLADHPGRVPQRLALAHYAALHRTSDQAMQAIAALDFGDFALAVALFKRALRELNILMATLAARGSHDESAALAHYRVEAMSRCFDLREVWLHVSAECREALHRSPQDEGDDDEDDES